MEGLGRWKSELAAVFGHSPPLCTYAQVVALSGGPEKKWAAIL